MKYLIDANNLAGKMGLLKNDNFDTMLLKELSGFASRKNCEIFVVFDSADPVGDKYKQDNVTVVYSPKDDYYKSADDKIVEIADELLEEDEIDLVTSDLELKDKVVKVSQDKNREKMLKTESAEDFAERINDKEVGGKNSKSKRLSAGDVAKINQELLDKFRKYEK